MKLRIRSSATKETIRVDAPDASSLFDLKALIASKLSSSSSSSSTNDPIQPEVVHVSLNRTDEIVASSPGESLNTLGLTSGDLLFYSLDSGFYSTTANQVPESVAPVEALAPVSPVEALAPVSPVEALAPVSPVEALAPLPSTPSDSSCMSSDSLTEVPADVSDVEMESDTFVLEKKVLAVPCFLRRVLETEKGKINGNMGLTVVLIHAVFLESGFVAVGSGGESSLPEGCTYSSHLVTVLYTLPDLINRAKVSDVKNAILKFSAINNRVFVYGCLVGAHTDVFRLSLDSSKLAPLLISATNELSGQEDGYLFQLWKIIKDSLSLPLLTDICQMNELLLPPCFTRLPTDLKFMILELLPGSDLAKVACTCSELRYLASNDELWRQKYLEEFQILDEKKMEGSWKEKFARHLKRKKSRLGTLSSLAAYIGTPSILTPWIPGTQRFPNVGGDYDLFPAMGGLSSLHRAGFNRQPGRRNFSPVCNLGGGGFR